MVSHVSMKNGMCLKKIVQIRRNCIRACNKRHWASNILPDLLAIFYFSHLSLFFVNFEINFGILSEYLNDHDARIYLLFINSFFPPNLYSNDNINATSKLYAANYIENTCHRNYENDNFTFQQKCPGTCDLTLTLSCAYNWPTHESSTIVPLWWSFCPCITELMAIDAQTWSFIINTAENTIWVILPGRDPTCDLETKIVCTHQRRLVTISRLPLCPSHCSYWFSSYWLGAFNAPPPQQVVVSEIPQQLQS